MSLSIIDKTVSPTGKRLDCKVKVTSLFAEAYEIKLRILSREEIKEADWRELINQVVDRKKEWKPTKKNLSLSLNGVNANAYITKINNDGKDNHSESS